MGFDLEVAREGGGGQWYACGWDVQPLYYALCDLGERLDHGAAVPVARLRFVRDAAARVREDPTWTKYVRVALIDYALADEWFECVGVDVRADMALAVIGDATDEGELAVLGELWRLASERWREAIFTLDDFLRGCEEDGVGSVVVTGG